MMEMIVSLDDFGWRMDPVMGNGEMDGRYRWG